jgi:hypothetical protein
MKKKFVITGLFLLIHMTLLIFASNGYFPGLNSDRFYLFTMSPTYILGILGLPTLGKSVWSAFPNFVGSTITFLFWLGIYWFISGKILRVSGIKIDRQLETVKLSKFNYTGPSVIAVIDGEKICINSGDIIFAPATDPQIQLWIEYKQCNQSDIA